MSKAVVFFDGVMKALKLTILTNPIFIIAAIIIAIGAAFVIAYMKCETFRNIVDAAVTPCGTRSKPSTTGSPTTGRCC